MPTLLVAILWISVLIVGIAHYRRGRFVLIDPAWAFLAGFAINYCVRPSLYLYDPSVGGIYQDDIYPEALIRHSFTGALLLALLGISGFAIGDWLFFRRSPVQRPLRDPSNLHQFSKSSFYRVVAFLLLIAGFIGLQGFVSASGWSGPILALLTGEQRDAFMEVILGRGYLTLAMQLSLVGWAMICAAWIAHPRHRTGLNRLGHASLRMAWFCATLLIWVAFGERSSIMTVLFIPMALYVTLSPMRTLEGRRTFRRAVVFLVLVVVLFAAVAGPIGLAMKGKEISVPGIISMSISAWDAFEFTVAAQNYIKVPDLKLGTTYAEDILYTWLPRLLFPSKPERYGAVTVQDMVAPDLVLNYGATFPTGILVEAYANFWYVGVFFVPLLLAYLFRLLRDRVLDVNWFWIMQAVLLFPLLASFRSLGWVLAAVIANCIVVALITSACRMVAWFGSAAHNLPAREFAGWGDKR